jgi:arylsulfatase A-like enzyme
MATVSSCRREGEEKTPEAAAPAAARRSLRDSSLLIVTLDTTRRDVLGFAARASFEPAHTPALDAFARSAVDFRRAWTVAPLTLPAHASLFTGLYPAVHGVRDNLGFRVPEAATTVAERLAALGFETAAVVAAPVIGRESGIGQGFASFEGPSREDGVEEWPAQKVTDAAAATLGRIAGGARPFFLWVHYFDAHAPHAVRTTPAQGRTGEGGAPYDEAEAYRGEVERIDRNFRRLLAAARSASGGRPLFVVVAADHGEGLGEHGEATHGHLLHEATLRVPLLMQHPSLAPGGCDAVASLVDVMPTLADVFEWNESGPVQGRSLLPCLLETGARGPDESRPVFFESRLPWHEFGWAWLDGATDGRWKRVDRPRTALFDLDTDPGETKDVSDQWPGRARELDAARQEFERVCAGAKPLSTSDGSASALTQLGYVAARTALPGDKSQLREPKDRFALIELRDCGLEELARGRYDVAVERFEQLKEQNPDPAPGTLLIAVVRSRQAEALPDGAGRTASLQRAEAAWRAAVESCPAEANRRFNLAQTLRDLGRDDEAIAELERVVALAPEDATAQRALDDVKGRKRATGNGGPAHR